MLTFPRTGLHLGPLLRAMGRNKLRVLLLGVEIAVTVAVVLNCAALVGEQLDRIDRDSGIEEDELIAVTLRPWSAEYQDRDFRRQVVRRDMDALRALPGVKDATPITNFPLQGGGSSFQLKPLGADDAAYLRSPYYSADPHVFDTLGLEIVEGRGFTDADVPEEPGPRIMNVVVTRDLADALFPDGDAVGQSVDTGSEEYPDVIVGVVDHMFTPYGGSAMESRITFYPNLPGDDQRALYLVRAEPRAYDQVFSQIDAAVLGVERSRVVQVQSLAEIRAGGFLQNVFLVNVFTLVMVLLLFVTGLGIFGITAFTVTQRTKQIGTRRALGAPKGAILTQFLAESSLVTLFGLGLGLVAAYGLNLLLVTNAGAPKLDPMLVLVGSLALWAFALLATWVPARRAARLSPALATRTV